MSHHVDELRYGQAELDDDHVGDVWHGPRPLVVAAEQLLEEIILGVRVGLAVTKNCRCKRRHADTPTHTLLAQISHCDIPTRRLCFSVILIGGNTEIRSVKEDWSCSGNAGDHIDGFFIPVSSNPLPPNSSKSAMMLWILGERGTVVKFGVFFYLVKSYWFLFTSLDLFDPGLPHESRVLKFVEASGGNTEGASLLHLLSAKCYYNVCVATQKVGAKSNWLWIRAADRFACRLRSAGYCFPPEWLSWKETGIPSSGDCRFHLHKCCQSQLHTSLLACVKQRWANFSLVKGVYCQTVCHSELQLMHKAIKWRRRRWGGCFCFLSAYQAASGQVLSVKGKIILLSYIN